MGGSATPPYFFCFVFCFLFLDFLKIKNKKCDEGILGKKGQSGRIATI
jgi:hypothetical protein